MYNKIANEYLEEGKCLIPLNGKKAKTAWNITNYTHEEISNYKGNLGWRLGAGDLVIDIDPRNGGFESYDKLKSDLGLKLNNTVKTPGGGYHIYLKISGEVKKLRKTIKETYPGVDFLSKGAYCLICGCKTIKGTYTWCDEDLGLFEQTEAPQNLLDILTYDNKNINTGNNLGEVSAFANNNQYTTKEFVLEKLNKLDPSMDNDNWVKVGMALHDWNSSEGLELWESWSKSGNNYKDGETSRRWRSFDPNSGVSMGTLNYMSKEADYNEEDGKLKDMMKLIDNSDEKQIEISVYSKIKKAGFSKKNIEKLAKHIQDKFKKITKVKQPIADIRREINQQTVVSGKFIEDSEDSSWVKRWVYVNSHAAFCNLDNLKLLKTEAFNITNGINVPEGESGGKQSASKYVSDRGLMETADILAYLPNVDEKLLTIEDFKVVNSFNKNTIPKESDNFTEEGLNAISKVEKHIEFIFGNKTNKDIFIQWLAHQVQYPGKQILWSPVIQSIQGVGKSFFGELLRSCLGDRNVGTVSPTQVTSDFNGWATNVTVNVLEELRVKGKNRHDAVNSLKPLITDRMIQINDKGVKQYITYNTTNYICFTNYKDSIPLDNDDRRWWVIFVDIESLEDMSSKIGENVTTYFPKLFEAVRSHGCEIRKWLLEYEITKEFLAIKQAPMTEEKLSMIATEESGLEGYVEIREMLESGGKYFNKDIISSSDLFDNVMFEHPNLSIETSKRNYILKKLGYTSLPKPIKIDGKSRRVWSKKPYTNLEVRELLKLN